MPKGVYQRTEWHRALSLVALSAATTPESRAKMSASKTGQPSGRKGKKYGPLPAARRAEISKAHAGVPDSHGHNVGGRATPTLVSWRAMMQRCYDPNKSNYRYYGGRGISVCLLWHDFENFLLDMGERPDGKQLSRVDNDGDYEPGNVTWQTAAENIAERNRRVARRA